MCQKINNIGYSWMNGRFACVVLPLIQILSVLYGGASPPLLAEMFCCLSLVLTRDMSSVEIWATEGAVWSCRVVTEEGRPPSVEVMAR